MIEKSYKKIRCAAARADERPEGASRTREGRGERERRSRES